MSGDEQWVDLRSAVAMTGATRSRIAWAMAQGDVKYSTKRPGHEHTPMVLLADVEWLAAQLPSDDDRMQRSL
jgi:hypothetical protein